MLKIKSVSSDKGEDQVRWNSWCISNVKKNLGFSAISQGLLVFSCFHICDRLVIQTFYMFVIFAVHFFQLSYHRSGGCPVFISFLR